MYYLNDGIKHYIANTADGYGVIDYTTNNNEAAKMKINNNGLYEYLEIINRAGDYLFKIYVGFRIQQGKFDSIKIYQGIVLTQILVILSQRNKMIIFYSIISIRTGILK